MYCGSNSGFQVGGNSALGLGLGDLFWGFMVVLFVDRASRLGFGPPYHKANDGVIQNIIPV